MVGSEARFHRCRVTEVVEELPGVCFRLAFQAEDAEWFSPDAPEADRDGWVRQLRNVRAELRAISDNHEAMLARARRWCAQGTLLSGFSDLEHQALGLYVAGADERGPDDYLVVRMDPKEMDRA